jgi:hypothetical protein
MSITLTNDQSAALLLMETNAESLKTSDLVKTLKEMRVKDEFIEAFVEMSTKTAKTVYGKTIKVGKIVTNHIVDFAVQNPSLTIGTAVGAAIGALALYIPWIGPMLAPLTIPLGALLGASAGAQLDALSKGKIIGPIQGIVSAATELANLFFKILIDVFKVIFNKESFVGK